MPAPTTLHVFDARALGEFAALATRAHLGERDAVLTIGSARQARPIAQLLGRPVRNHPVRRGASARSIDAIARRTARSLGAGEIRHASGGDGAAPDLGALPSRDEARAQVGCEGLLTVAPRGWPQALTGQHPYKDRNFISISMNVCKNPSPVR